MADITVIGNVNNPEVKTTQNGKVFMNFSLAENHFRNVNGEWQEDGTTWRQVTVWERTAEALADVLQSGQRVIVVGQERLREYETRDGAKGKSLDLTAKHVGIVPKAPQQGQQSQQGGYGRRYAGDHPGGPSGYQQEGAWTPSPGPAPVQQDPWAGSQPQTDEPPF